MALDPALHAAEGLDMLHRARCSVARRRRRFAVVAAVAVVLGLAGCVGAAGDAAKLRQQAQAALARWADAVSAAGGRSRVVPVGELTGQLGDWELAVGDNNKRALMAGLVAAATSLPSGMPPDGEVTWPDGTVATVPLLSAEQALAAIWTGPTETCGDCASLWVTGARLTAGPISTSRGPATAPLWEFTLQDTAVRVTRVAIADPVMVVPPPWDSDDPPIGLRIDAASGTVGGRELTVTFVGAPLPGDQPCGEDYTAEAVESDLAVVVIVTRHPHLTFSGCSAVGAQRTASVELAAPLGERAVLEVQQGLPVPVVLSP
jgi:hypothetical protein